MIQPIQIFGWIILVIIPVIFLVIIKPEKTTQYKEIKRIVCFILMGIFALRVIANLLSLFQLRSIPSPVWQFLSLGGFIPAVTALLFPFVIKLSMFPNFYMTIGRFIFPLLDLLLSAGMIFFFYTKAKQPKEGYGSLTEGEKQFSARSDPVGASDVLNKIESKFSGGVFPIFLFWIWAPILLVITLGLATPFIVCTVIRWICNNSSIGGKRYRFKGTAMGLFGRWILWYLLTIITIGIYGFWSTRNQIRWIIENVEMIN
jgi:uncharacterized membrane protein YjgN (DUF898 family)